MAQSKCESCHRRETCALHHMAVLSLAFVDEAATTPGSEWDRERAVRRALRGGGTSPGFVEDWRFAGALDRGDIRRMVKAIVLSGRADLRVISRDCRHYVGPDLDETEDRSDAA